MRRRIELGSGREDGIDAVEAPVVEVVEREEVEAPVVEVVEREELSIDLGLEDEETVLAAVFDEKGRFEVVDKDGLDLIEGTEEAGQDDSLDAVLC